jgi:hypothetical protein
MARDKAKDRAPANAPTRPADEAAEGTPGTGENICPACSGCGSRAEGPCPQCNGTGRITGGVGGA